MTHLFIFDRNLPGKSSATLHSLLSKKKDWASIKILSFQNTSPSLGGELLQMSGDYFECYRELAKSLENVSPNEQILLLDAGIILKSDLDLTQVLSPMSGPMRIFDSSWPATPGVPPSPRKDHRAFIETPFFPSAVLLQGCKNASTVPQSENGELLFWAWGLNLFKELGPQFLDYASLDPFVPIPPRSEIERYRQHLKWRHPDRLFNFLGSSFAESLELKEIAFQKILEEHPDLFPRPVDLYVHRSYAQQWVLRETLYALERSNVRGKEYKVALESRLETRTLLWIKKLKNRLMP